MTTAQLIELRGQLPKPGMIVSHLTMHDGPLPSPKIFIPTEELEHRVAGTLHFIQQLDAKLGKHYIFNLEVHSCGDTAYNAILKFAELMEKIKMVDLWRVLKIPEDAPKPCNEMQLERIYDLGLRCGYKMTHGPVMRQFLDKLDYLRTWGNTDEQREEIRKEKLTTGERQKDKISRCSLGPDFAGPHSYAFCIQKWLSKEETSNPMWEHMINGLLYYTGPETVEEFDIKDFDPINFRFFDTHT